MGLSLGEKWSFCVPEDQVILMDIASNTYVMLPPSLASSFDRLRMHEPLDGRDMPGMAKLLQAGIIAQQEEQGAILPCSLPVEPTCGFDDRDLSGWSAHDLLQAILALGRARYALRRHDLAGILAQIRDRKQSFTGTEVASAHRRARAIAAAFYRLNALVTRYDQCLLRSLAMMRCLLAHRVPANLVFGVATRPFRAHCWLQHGGLVLNDTLEGIGNYTPILVV
ncbi:lasso peptide biosynthesis B2 protein [Novosphingobium sp. SG707]|uniref:lasso peptide biosynthesis B2 protein n=1 Tax=Novosphingobium sp. SG707 TaxID=2586996 RepID=UPI0014452829|nr:lasso peptide biosynthesis B2 protein [Novosphingobium sp. SG707]NKJ02402.1 hypothetical protein [Novosphingobium sp. SG707]